MNPQEQQMLQELLDRVASAPASPRDPQADGIIQQCLASRPDSLYLLAQVALVNEIALHNAHAQIQELQHKLAAPQTAPSGPWAQPQMQQPAPAGSFMGDFLRTASSVVAGSLAFSALSSLWGGGHGGAGSGFLSGAPVSENIANNYYVNDSLASDGYNSANEAASSADYSADDTSFASDDSSSDFL